MPEMDGLEFFKRLRISGIATPFILFTGKGREEVVIEAMRHGVDFYIKKGGDAKSQFAELINAIRQCTAREEAEEALEHNARRFRTMIENQSEIIALADLNGNFKFISNSLKRILGYEPDELIGKNVASIFVDPSLFISRPRIGQPGTVPGPVVQYRSGHEASRRFGPMHGDDRPGAAQERRAARGHGQRPRHHRKEAGRKAHQAPDQRAEGHPAGQQVHHQRDRADEAAEICVRHRG